MVIAQLVRFEMLSRVRDFGAAHQSRFPESSPGRVAFAAIAAAIAQLETLAAARLIAVREARRDRRTRRAAVLEKMKVIAHTSRGVITASGAPLRLRMPQRRSDVFVLTTARAFLGEAEPRREQLVTLGLPPTCLAELEQATEAFADTLADRREGRATVAAAAAGMDLAFDQAFAALRTLDIVVPNATAGDPVAWATWTRARKVIEGRGRRLSAVEGASTRPAGAPNAGPQEAAVAVDVPPTAQAS